ncbi:MAG: aspartate/glutamate racemase family protein [Acetobacteraceae bacterium]
MRLLLVNPNITAAMTEAMAAEARRYASPGTEVVSATAAFGTEYVETRVEAAIAGHAVLEALAAQGGDCDAAIVAAFGDPGLAAAKEMMAIPVVGLTEAAVLAAWALGRRFAIVCLTPRLGAWYRDTVEAHGLAGRLVAVRALNVAIPDILRAKEQTRAALVAECRRAVDQDGAEVVILGGGPLAGLAREAGGEIPVPALDGVSCAVRLAEQLAVLRPRAPGTGSFASVAGKPARGLSAALTRRVSPGRA